MDYIKLAKEIIACYELDDPEISFMRHHENITYKLTEKRYHRSFLLRIHVPVTEGLAGIQQTLEGLKSEMKLLQELHLNRVIHVQEPIANRIGDWVTVFPSSELGTSCFATLLTWIEGATLTLQEEQADEIVFALGESLAALHHFTRSQQPLANLVRPSYDASRIDDALEDLQYGVEIGLFDAEQFALITEVLGIVKKQLMELDGREQSWGLVHADIQLGNVVVSAGRPCLIDFGLSGYSYDLFDVGSGSSCLPCEWRRTFLDGYASRRSFQAADVRYVEGMILMDIFVSYCFYIRDLDKNGWIKADAAQVCETLCGKFISGNRIYELF